VLLTNKFILVPVAVVLASLTITGVAKAQPSSKITSTVAPTTTLPSTGGTGFGGVFSDSVPEEPWWQIPPRKHSQEVLPPKRSHLPAPKTEAPANPQPVHLRWVLSGDILFDSGSAKLSVAAESQLAGIVAQAQLHPGCLVDITGYTDNVPDGYPGGNLGLSLARAREVASYFGIAGLSGDRMTTAGDGAADPVGDNASAQGRQLNRRVVISLTCS
jgi:outer membrane protein OmpA-like peptidoglycan-associated protein